MNLKLFQEKIGWGYRRNLWDVDFNFKVNKSTTHIFDYVYGKFNEEDVLKLGESSKNGIVSFALNDFQTPGITLSVSDEVFKNNSHVINRTNGVIKCTIINDDLNVAFRFWQLYCNKIHDGLVVQYKDDYSFDVTVDLKSQKNSAVSSETIAFHYVYPTGIEDLDYITTPETSLHSFAVNLNYTWYQLKAK